MRLRITNSGPIWPSVRHAARSLARSPAFSIVVTVVLAVGIAGSVVVYSIAEALLFRPIPYADPDSLYIVSVATPGITTSQTVNHWELFEWLRARRTPLEAVGAYWSRGANISGDGWSERLEVGSVSREFLPMTDVRPPLGRGFLETEFQAGSGRVALLTHSVWQRRFAGAPGAVGRIVVVDDTAYTIVGILPADFKSIDELGTGSPTWFDSSLGVLVPLLGDPTLSSRRGSSATATLRVLARLRKTTMLPGIRRDLAVFSTRLPWPSGRPKPSYTLTPLAPTLNPGVPERIALLSAAVAVLLVVACANAALLMLQRRESRRLETEIRSALGGTPPQLASEALVEALLLGVSACGVGLAIAWAVIRVTRSVGGAAITGLSGVQVGWHLVGFAAAVALGAALAAGLAPYVRLLRHDGAVSRAVSGASYSPPKPGSLPSSIVVGQLGLSVGLIVVGTMLAKDFSRLAAVDLGYQADGVLVAQVALSPLRHTDRGRQFFDHLLDRLREQPGVEAALVFPAPGALVMGALSGRVEGYGDEALPWRVVSPSFFSLLGVPILAGRSFTDADRQRAEPVVLVNSAFAERYWGSVRSAIGRKIFIGSNPKGVPGPPVTIIGVARDMANPWGGTVPHEMYVTYAKAAQWVHLAEMTLLVRAADRHLPPLRARLAEVARDVDPYQPLFNVRALADVVSASRARTRLLLVLIAAFSALATLLAAVGVYVVLAFAVTSRTREFGIRLALGAPRQGVLLHVLGGTLRLVAKGVALTVPLTYGAVWLSAAQLFGVTDTDPMTCVWAIGLIIAAALVASLVPAWRATRVNPIVALRQE